MARIIISDRDHEPQYVSILQGTSECSWSFWFSGTTDAATLMTQGNNNDPPSMQYAITVEEDGTVHYYDKVSGWAPGYNHDFGTVVTVLDGGWHNIVVVRVGLMVKIYIDATERASNTAADVVDFSSGQSWDYNYIELGSDHIVDDVGVWQPRALTPGEISQIYTRGLASKSLLQP